MKFQSKLLTLAVSSLLVTQVANAAEIFNKDGNKINLTGKVEAVYKFRNKYTPDFNGWHQPNYVTGQTYNRGNLSDHRNNEDKTYARLGFKGETQINSELVGYSRFEYQFNSNHQENNTKESDATRYAFVGLKFANYGSLDFGRNYGVSAIIRDFTDVAPRFGADGFGGGTDLFMTGRSSSLVTYSNRDFFGAVPGWNFYLQYQAKDTSNDKKEKHHGDGFGFTTTYDIKDIGVGLGFTYSKSDRTEDQLALGKTYDSGFRDANNSPIMYNYSSNGSNAEIWGLGAKYDANNIYAAITYAETKNMISTGKDWKGGQEIANKTKGLEAHVAYLFDFGLEPAITYNQQRGYDLNGFERTVANPMGRGTSYLVKYVALGSKYYFNKNMDMAIGYKINLLDKDGEYVRRHQLDTDDQFEMRLTYSF